MGAYDMSLRYLSSTVFTTLFGNTQKWHRQGTHILPSVVCYEAWVAEGWPLGNNAAGASTAVCINRRLDGWGAGSGSEKMAVTEKSDVKPVLR